jgi:hypothetical protein
MAQQEMQAKAKDSENPATELKKLAATCNDLALQIAALRKRVRQIEVDFYKDISVSSEMLE